MRSQGRACWRIMASIKIGTNDQNDQNPKAHSTQSRVDVFESPKTRPAEIGIATCRVGEEIKAERAPCKAKRCSNEKSRAKPSRSVPILAAERREEDKSRTDSNGRVRNS